MNCLNDYRSFMSLVKLFTSVLLVSLNIFAAKAQANGYTLIKEAAGVKLYQKNNTGKNPFFVQTVDLSKGACLYFLAKDFLTGTDTHPYFERKSLPEVWEGFEDTCSHAFAVVSGQFFRKDKEHTNITSLAFPVKSDSQMISYGYNNGLRVRKRCLLIEREHAQMIIYRGNPEKLEEMSAPQLLVGLHPAVNKQRFQYIGRTFVGIKDANKDKKYEQILIFSAHYASQKEAVKTLKRFGAKKIMMLEGGEAAQMICKGQRYVQGTETIPHVIGILSGKD